MNVQYISDGKGKTTGVYIPIDEWNKLKEKYSDLNVESYELPDWHKNKLNEREEDYSKNPNQVLDFDKAISDIEENL